MNKPNLILCLYIHIRTQFICSGHQAVYLPDQKIIYYPIPKNANSYLTSVFLCNHPSTQIYNPATTTALEFINNRKPRSFFAPKSALNNSGYKKIALVRDPAKRLVSCFLDKLVKQNEDQYEKQQKFILDINQTLKTNLKFEDLTFNHFLRFIEKTPDWRRNPHYKSQSYFLKNVSLDKIFDVEEMNELIEFLKTTGVHTDLPQTTNQGVGKKTKYSDSIDWEVPSYTIDQLRKIDNFPNYKNFFDEENQTKLAALFSEDIDLHLEATSKTLNQYWHRINASH